MADPTKYVPSYSYSNWQATNPTRPLPAPQVDNDLANISRSVNQSVDAIRDVRRADGKLKNGIVGPDSLAPQLSLGFSFEGLWQLAHYYQAGDGVVYQNAFYNARYSHLSSALLTPSDASVWNYLFSVEDLAVAGAISLPTSSFTGDGESTIFDLTFTPISARNVFVTISGVVQDVEQYSILNDTIIFTAPPPAGVKGQVRGFASLAGTIVPVDGSVTFDKLDPALQTSKTKADNALPRSGGIMTGPITGDDGGTVRTGEWIANNVRNKGADASGAALSDTAFTAARAIGKQIRIPVGTFKLSSAYSMTYSGVLAFESGAVLIKPDGSVSNATIGNNALQIAAFLNQRYADEARSGGIAITPTGKIKSDSSTYSGVNAFETAVESSHLWYSRDISPSGTNYTVGGVVRDSLVQYGFGSSASGTVANDISRMNMYGITDIGNGRVEATPVARGVTYVDGYAHPKANTYNDICMTLSKQDQPGFAATLSGMIKNRHPTETLDADHDGVYGAVMVTTPYATGFGSPIDRNYPARAAYHAHGWSRDPALTAANGRTDGQATDANFGFRAGYLAGGLGGGVWTDYVDRAKFDKAFEAYDYYTGLHLAQAHPHATDPQAIHVWRDGGKSILGMDASGWAGNSYLHVGTGGSGSGESIRLYPSPAGTTRRTTINFNNEYLLLSDPSLNNTAGLGIYSGAAGVMSMFIDANGMPGFNRPIKLMSFTVATLPSVSAYSGAIIRVSNGNANRQIAISDGTNWRFADGAIVS